MYQYREKAIAWDEVLWKVFVLFYLTLFYPCIKLPIEHSTTCNSRITLNYVGFFLSLKLKYECK